MQKNLFSFKGSLFAAFLLIPGFGEIAYAVDWNLKDRNGVQYTLPALHGKWVQVNFWAPWCPSCLREMPDLDAMQQRHKDMQVIGVSVMYESRQKVTDAINKLSLSISCPIVFGNEDTAGDFGGLNGLPAAFCIRQPV